MRSWWAVLLPLALGACLQSSSVTCGDGRVCPRGSTCNLDLGICVEDGQRAACDGLAEDDVCEFRGASGRCRSGICVATVCGDGIVEGAEECDGDNLGVDRNGDAQTCVSIGYDMGALSCNRDCTYHREDCAGICGDGNVDPDEDCEIGVAQDVTDCQQLGYYDTAPITCNAACRYDVGACSGFCGDSTLNGGEDCDGSVGTTTCQSVGFYSTNAPTCNAACRFDTSTCSGSCGDQLVNGPELCDGTPPSDTCLDLGFTGGLMSCSSGCTPYLPSCIRGDWRMIGSYPTFAYFFDMWALAPDNIYLVGDYGAFHWNGAKIEAVAGLPTFTQGLAVWGSSADDVWIFGFDNGGGSGKRGFHFNGTAWTPLATPPRIADLWGTAANNIYGVGSDGVYHFDGVSWTQINPDSSYRAVHGTDANNVWIVGASGAVQHFDGATWTTVDAGTPANLLSVFSLSPTNVYVGSVGGLRHMVGNTWSIEIPNIFPEAIAATGPSNVWASEGVGSIYHFDGTGWTKRPHPDNLSCEGLQIVDGAVYEIGDENHLYRYDGLYVRAFAGLPQQSLRAVWGDEHFAVSVGNAGTIVQWDGETWTQQTSPTTVNLVAVWGSSPTDVYAAGTDVLLHYTGSTWDIVSGITGAFTEIWGSGPDDIYVAALRSSTPQHWDGNTWQALTPLTQGFSTVWGTGPDDVYVGFTVGLSGDTFRHWNGASWSTLPWTEYGSLAGAGATVVTHSPGDQYANSDRTMRAQDLVSPRVEISANATSGGGVLGTITLNDLAVSGPGDMIAVGKDGAMRRYDGVTWWPLASGVNQRLNAIGGRGRSQFAVGDNGTIVQITFDDAVSACTASGAEQDCTNDVDDDCDFLVDAHDPDCRDTGLCWAPRDVTCGSSTTTTFGQGVATVRNYGCSTKLHRGVEDVYRIVPPANGSMTVTLSSFTEDIDLFVVGATSGGACDPAASCLAASETQAQTGPEQATVPISSGTPVFVLVDDNGGGEPTDYTLQVTCN